MLKPNYACTEEVTSNLALRGGVKMETDYFGADDLDRDHCTCQINDYHSKGT